MINAEFISLITNSRNYLFLTNKSILLDILFNILVEHNISTFYFLINMIIYDMHMKIRVFNK